MTFPRYAAQNEYGVYTPQETVELPMPRKGWRGGPLAAIDLARTAGGWRSATEYSLETRGHSGPIHDRDPAFRTREGALGYGVNRLRSAMRDADSKLARAVLRWLDEIDPKTTEEPLPEPDPPPCNTPPASLEQAGLGRRCVECLGPVDTSRDERKLFCSDEHRAAFHNRQTVRGRKIMPLVIAERITRGGDRRYPRAKTGITARKRARRLIAIWVAEDKAAGRMAMDEYVELRERLGFQE